MAIATAFNLATCVDIIIIPLSITVINIAAIEFFFLAGSRFRLSCRYYCCYFTLAKRLDCDVE